MQQWETSTWDHRLIFLDKLFIIQQKVTDQCLTTERKQRGKMSLKSDLFFVGNLIVVVDEIVCVGAAKLVSIYYISVIVDD